VGIEILPPSKVRSTRVVGVAKRLKLFNESVEVGSPTQFRKWIEDTATIAEIVRGRLEPVEASALGRVAPHSTLIEMLADGSSAEFDVAGSRIAETRDIRLDDPRDALNDPLLELKLRRDGQLLPGERIARTLVRMGPRSGAEKHPLRVVADAYEERANRFNRSLNNLYLQPNAADLESFVRAEQDVWTDIVRELESHGLVEEMPAAGASRHILLSWGEGTFGPGWHYESYEIDDGRRGVLLRIDSTLHRDLTSMKPSSEVAELLEIDDVDAVVRSSMGYADSAIGALLGYGDYDVRIAPPEDFLAIGN